MFHYNLLLVMGTPISAVNFQVLPVIASWPHGYIRDIRHENPDDSRPSWQIHTTIYRQARMGGSIFNPVLIDSLQFLARKERPANHCLTKKSITFYHRNVSLLRQVQFAILLQSALDLPLVPSLDFQAS
ncbi:hypothetical protein C8J56DRAFT_355467 [Mycena floridula]|nr:hypothetical protein C8J56DRAFT_355467 [Mycena floridula]